MSKLLITTAIVFLLAVVPLGSANPDPDRCIYNDGHGTKVLCVDYSINYGAVYLGNGGAEGDYISTLEGYVLCDDPTCTGPGRTPIAMLWSRESPLPNWCYTIYGIGCYQEDWFPPVDVNAVALDPDSPLLCRFGVDLWIDILGDGDYEIQRPSGEQLGPCEQQS